jgi:hypothetical protein
VRVNQQHIPSPDFLEESNVFGLWFQKPFQTQAGIASMLTEPTADLKEVGHA